MNYLNLAKKEKEIELQKELSNYEKFKGLNLKLDMSRGKPCKEQLDICMGMLDELNSNSNLIYSQDYRNYGILDGIKEIKTIFCELMNIKSEEIIVNGNASLNLMYDTLQRGLQFGVLGNVPMNKQGNIKWLCPAPGYDRHFAVTELFGIEMINISMQSSGPDMDMIEKLVESDESIKGIWCVPKYSNPQGITYSDETVKRFANLKPKAKDFRIYWDNAYMVHTVGGKKGELLDIFDEAKKAGNEDIVYMFGSTSKITFAGAGIAFMAGSKANMDNIRKSMTIQTIGANKINQLQHALYFKNAQGIIDIMEKHNKILTPKFDMVDRILTEELGDSGLVSWTKPEGGYFISCDLLNGLAKAAISLAKEMGVVFTPAGSTYPYMKDPNDSNMRIAPSLPPIKELEAAMQVFACAVKLAYLKSSL